MIATLLAVGAALALAAASYLMALTLASLRPRPAPAPAGAPRLRFDLVVPAHDEAAGIAATVRSLLAADYPPELRRVLVVADNCRDATAARAAEAGACVLVRDEPGLRGKGHALALAFARSLGDGFADAVVVVDADSSVSPNLLRAFAARLSAGEQAVQAAAAVRNRDDSWRTRLMALSLAVFNGVRSLGRDRLGLSCGLRGNGMCLSTAALRAHPYRAFSLVEDLEYGLALGRGFVRVAYAPEAWVASDMVSSGSAAAPQRRRWEGGRAALARAAALPLLRDAARARSLLLLDLALDLLVPPLTTLSLFCAAGLACAALAGAPLWPWALTLACLAAYVARGWQLSGLGASGLRAAAWAPVYVAWKLFAARGAGRGAWTRTAREPRSA